jgi:hypothetical protein
VRTKTRRHVHISLAIVFGVAYFGMLALQIFWPKTFELVWRQVLLFISFYAISATHIAGASAETPMDDEPL